MRKRTVFIVMAAAIVIAAGCGTERLVRPDGNTQAGSYQPNSYRGKCHSRGSRTPPGLLPPAGSRELPESVGHRGMAGSASELSNGMWRRIPEPAIIPVRFELSTLRKDPTHAHRSRRLTYIREPCNR